MTAAARDRSHRRRVVIVGAGLAGAKAAQALREEGFDGRRRAARGRARAALRAPAAVEGATCAASPPRAQVYVHDAGFYDEHAIELRTGRAVEPIDAAGRDGRARRRRAARATTGCCSPPAREPRRLRCPAPSSTASSTCARSPTPTRCASASCAGGRRRRDRRGLDRLRGRGVGAPEGHGGDARRAVARCRSSACSAASSARSTRERPRRARRRAAARTRRRRRSRATERVERVRLARRPRARLRLRRRRRRRGAARRARRARRARGRRRRRSSTTVPADERRRASSPPATSPARTTRCSGAGCASSTGPTRSTRARPRRARCSGSRRAYDRLPYFFSDQYDVGMEYTGHAAGWDEVVVRGDPAAREFIAFWLREGRVLAGDERQRLGRDREPRGAHPLTRSGAPRPAARRGHRARRAQPTRGRVRSSDSPVSASCMSPVTPS